MSRINCETTEDLIPLYVDKVLSKSSVELVEEHLAECEKCSRKVNALTGDTVIKSYDDKRPLTRIKKSVLNHKATIAIVTISAVFVIFGLGLLFNILDMIWLNYSYDEVKDNLKLISASDMSETKTGMGTALVYDGKHKKFSTHGLIDVIGEKNGKTQVEVTVFMERSAYEAIDPFYYLKRHINPYMDSLVYFDEAASFTDDFYDENGKTRYNFPPATFSYSEDDVVENMEVVRLYYGTYSVNYVTHTRLEGERHLLWAKAGYEE